MKPPPSEPPLEYRGKRVGDTFAVKGTLYVVVALLPSTKHWCDLGWACRGSWEVLSKQLRVVAS